MHESWSRLKGPFSLNIKAGLPVTSRKGRMYPSRPCVYVMPTSCDGRETQGLRQYGSGIYKQGDV
jgi:hypothetical protein